MKIFPNPANDRLLILNLAAGQPAEYRIFNSLGAEVHKGILSSREELDIVSWPAGMYYLAVMSERKNTAVKLLIKH